MNTNPLPETEISEINHVAGGERSFARRAIGATLLAGSIAAFVFEQSPANESLRASEAVEIINEGGNEIEAGLTVFGVTMAIELGSSALIIAGINQKGGVMNSTITKSRARKQRREEEGTERKLQKSRKKLLSHTISNSRDTTDLDIKVQEEAVQTSSKFKSALGYTGVSLGVGAGIVVVDEKMKTDKPSIKKDIMHAAAASTLISAVSGTIGYLGTGGIRHLENTSLEWPAEKFVDYAADFRFWAIVISPIMLTRFGRWVSDIRREKKESND